LKQLVNVDFPKLKGHEVMGSSSIHPTKDDQSLDPNRSFASKTETRQSYLKNLCNS